ncbi:MAG: hypothetical protein HQL15_01390 [Candidatus Omnitrophica bacterium]|nr:hypothetical protein [Candidatus Omnitrophota bacterium]
MADSNPLFDLKKFKEMAKDGLVNKPYSYDSHSEALFTMALALSAAVKKVFYEKSEYKFSAEPALQKMPIVQFVSRMRIDAMEKFNNTTFLSAVHFYRDAAALGKDQPLGLIIVYIERTFVPEMLRLFKYPYIDYDNNDEVLDGIGAISNLIAGSFKIELGRLGYVDLEMSHFRSAINSVLDGLEYCKNQNQKYEISFEIDGKKRMVVELVMDPLPKVIKED